MSIITRMLKQTCVYWPLASSESAGVDADSYGQPDYGTPVEINCRWEDSSKEFLNDKDEIQVSAAIVYVEIDVDKKGVLMLGDLDDVTDESYPLLNDGAREIKRFDKVPNLKATEFLRMAYL